MAKQHIQKVEDVILGRARMMGIKSLPELQKKVGVPLSTLYRHIKSETLTLSELRLINRKVHFTVKDAEALLGPFTKEE